MLIQIVQNTEITTVLFLLVIAAYGLFSSKTTTVQVADIALILALIIATGLRFNVGADYMNYYNMYQSLLAQPDYLDFLIEVYGVDAGFWALCALLSKTPLGASPYAIFWFSSILIYPLTVIYFRKKTGSAAWALAVFLFLGYFGMSINVLRHAIAATILLWAFEALHTTKGRAWVRFAILTALASLFHVSALTAALIMVLALRFKPTRALLGGMLAGGFVLLLVYPSVLRFVATHIPLFSRFANTLDSLSGELYRQYQWIAVACYVILYALLALLLTDKRNVALDDRTAHMTTCVILALPLSIVALSVWPLNRIPTFLFQFAYALVPFYLASTRQARPHAEGLVMLGMILWHVPYCLFAWNNVTPFVTYLH